MSFRLKVSLGPSRAGSQGRALLLPVVDCVTFDTAGSWPFEWKAKWAGRLASIVVDARSRVRGSGQWADIAEKLELFLRDLGRLTDVCLVWVPFDEVDLHRLLGRGSKSLVELYSSLTTSAQSRKDCHKCEFARIVREAVGTLQTSLAEAVVPWPRGVSGQLNQQEMDLWVLVVSFTTCWGLGGVFDWEGLADEVKSCIAQVMVSLPDGEDPPPPYTPKE
jgi:hypothetical protein